MGIAIPGKTVFLIETAPRLETVTVSHQPITWPMYLPDTVAQGQAHCADISFVPSQSTFSFLKCGYIKFDFENPRSWSWLRSKFLVTTWVQHPVDWHPFGFMSIHPLILMIELFLNLTFKTQGRGHSSRSHSRHNILSTHIPFIPCWSALPILRYSYLENWPWKSKSNAMGKVEVQSHNVRLTFYRLTSLWFILFGLPFLRYSIFKIRPWKSKVKVKWPWCCTATGLDSSIERQML